MSMREKKVKALISFYKKFKGKKVLIIGNKRGIADHIDIENNYRYLIKYMQPPIIFCLPILPSFRYFEELCMAKKVFRNTVEPLWVLKAAAIQKASDYMMELYAKRIDYAIYLDNHKDTLYMRHLCSDNNIVCIDGNLLASFFQQIEVNKAVQKRKSNKKIAITKDS